MRHDTDKFDRYRTHISRAKRIGASLSACGMKVTGFELSARWASQVLTSLPFWAGMACYAVSIVVWLFVLSRLQVSLAYPFQAAGYILGSVICMGLFG